MRGGTKTNSIYSSIYYTNLNQTILIPTEYFYGVFIYLFYNNLD